MKKIILAALACLVLTACANDATVVSYNISQDAQNFKIVRRIVFYNGITNDYILSVEGLCSIDDEAGNKKIGVTCKVAEGNYKKHYLHISDNVTYFSEQMEAGNASTSRYKVTFKPSVIIPDIVVR
jgi:hypothetical protein